MLKLKLNFKIGEPTVNGRIYKKDLLENAINERLEKSLFITNEFNNNGIVNFNDIIGKVDSFKILEVNSVEFNVTPISDKLFENQLVSCCGFGNLCGETISDYKLISLFVVN